MGEQLEVAIAENIRLEAQTRNWMSAIDRLTAERDALAAVIEQAKVAWRGANGWREQFEATERVLASVNTNAALTEWHAKQHEGEVVRLDGDWITVTANGCTCAGGFAAVGYAHERGCGREPLANVADELRGVRAIVWDEGEVAGRWNASFEREARVNPYREGRDG